MDVERPGQPQAAGNDGTVGRPVMEGPLDHPARAGSRSLCDREGNVLVILHKCFERNADHRDSGPEKRQEADSHHEAEKSQKFVHRSSLRLPV